MAMCALLSYRARGSRGHGRNRLSDVRFRVLLGLRTRECDSRWTVAIWRATGKTVASHWGTRRPGSSQGFSGTRSEEHTSELQSRGHLVCRVVHVKKKSQVTQSH